MSKIEKLIDKILQNRPVSYNDAERMLKYLGFELNVCGSHHIFRKKGYGKNISIKKRPQLLPYQIRDLPKQVQKLEFCQSQRSRFNPLEAAPIQVDRCDAEGVKGGDVGEGKNQLLNLFGYTKEVLRDHGY